MAYIVNRTETAAQVSGTSYQVTLGAHVSGDLLLVCMTQDGGSATDMAPNAAAVTAGWVMVGTQSASQGSKQAWAYLVADSSSETNPTFTGANDDWIGTCIVIRDADTTTPIEAWMRSNWGNSINISTAASNTVAASSAGGTTVITPSADSLLIYAWCSDGSQIAMRTKLADAIADSKRSATTNEAVSHIICHNQLATAACPDVTMYCAVATEGGNGWVLSIKNKSGGKVQKQARVTANENTGISNWFGNFGAVHSPVTWAKPSTFVAAAGGAQTITINGTAITVSDVALGTVTTTSIQNESLWGTISSIPHATDATVIAGANWVLPAPENLSGKIVTFNYELDSSSINGRIGTEGMICGFASSDGNYVVYQLRTKVQGWAISQAFAAFIDLGNATVIASAGTVDLTAVDRFMIGWHRATGTGTVNIGIKNMSVLTKAAITGGGDDDPANFKVLADDMASWGHYRWADVQGLTQVLAKFNVQIGDGSHATYFDSAPAFEFARAYSTTSREWNVNANRVSLDIYAKAGDTINLAAGIVATETAQAVTINASSSTSATYSMAGQAFKGLSGFTDNAGIALTNPTYKECGTVSLKANMTGMSVSKTVGAVPAVAMTANSKTLTRCTTNVTGTSATYHLELSTAVDAITLADHTFTGSAATNKVHVLKTTGTVTITISGTTSLISADVTSAGATVVIAAPQPTLDATVLASSRVVLYNNTTDAELDNTAPAGTSWSKVITSGASANDSLTLHVFKEGYQEFQTTFLYTGDDATILVTQETDPNLTSLRTELGITDYTTITEFALDITGSVEIDADDADGSTTKARLAIWYNGVLTTENGARYLRGAITILSTAAFRINTSVLDLKIENISATFGLNFTDTERRLYRDDGAPIYAAASAPGSIQNDYSGVPDTVETGVSGLTGSESAQLMALPSAATIATQVLTSAQSAPIYADVRKVTGVTVTGVGTEADPWGP